MKRELYTGSRKEDARPYYTFTDVALNLVVTLGYVLETARDAMWKDCTGEGLSVL